MAVRWLKEEEDEVVCAGVAGLERGRLGVVRTDSTASKLTIAPKNHPSPFYLY